MRDEWKCVLMEDGELCLMMDGRTLMVKLYADNWAIVYQVSLLGHNTHTRHTCLCEHTINEFTFHLYLHRCGHI